MYDLIKEIWQTLSTNRLRTFLTGISVSWGIFMLVLLLSVSQGLLDQFGGFTRNRTPYTLEIYGGRTSLPFEGLDVGRNIALKNADISTIENSSETRRVTDVRAHTSFNANISTVKDYVSASCSGFYPYDVTNDYELQAGRKINDVDMAEQRKVAILPIETMNTLFGAEARPDEVVGGTVTIDGIAYTVIGIYKHRWVRDVLIPYTTARAVKGFPDDVQKLVVEYTPVSNMQEAQSVDTAVRRTIAHRARFNPSDPSALWVRNEYENQEQAMMGLNILNVAMWIIGLLTLLTGIVGVSNIMFVSVRERTHEIGIRRAIGAKPRSILTQIILESVVLTTVFGYIGIVMGAAFSWGVGAVLANTEVELQPVVDLNIAVQVTIALIIAGALAGLFPAMRALKINPVEALRDE